MRIAWSLTVEPDSQRLTHPIGAVDEAVPLPLPTTSADLET